MAFLLGTLGNDTLTGTLEFDLISALDGNDIVIGLDGDDQLNGNLGNDTITGDLGNDLLRGGKNNDLLFGQLGNETIFGDLGNDTAFGGDGNDLLYGDQGLEANFGGDGNDFLLGELGNDTLFGLDGNDSLNGNQGADVLNGNQGNDTVNGGEGNDLIRGGIDNDQLFGEVGEDTLYGDLGDDTISGGDGRDLILGIRGEDFLLGNADDDEMNGNQGNDTLDGGEGNDILRGGRDNDLILGGLGNDFLYGDGGIDTLTSGEGKDVFFLRQGVGSSTLADAAVITDFAKGTDLIGLIEGLTFEKLNISPGTGANASDTVIQESYTGQILAVLKGINRNTIDRTDFTVPGVLAFSNPTFQVNEDGTPIAAVTVTRTDGSDGAVSVAVIPSDGFATTSPYNYNARTTAPYDYDKTPILVNFADGETSQTLSIPIVDDNFGEYSEPINLALGNPTGGATIGTQSTTVLDIVDNDPVATPRLTFRSPNNAWGFGSQFTFVGNNILIGSPPGGTDSNSTAVAYLFDGNTGALLAPLLIPSLSYSNPPIATVGNNVVIGVPSDPGVAYLFDGNTGSLLKTFLNPSVDFSNYNFGSQIAAVGNSNILISAPGGSGAAYLFDSATGTLLQTFLNPSPNQGYSFGSRVASVGNNILISGFSAPAAYLFDSNTGALLTTFLNPSLNQFNNFGSQMTAVGNHNILITAPQDQTGGIGAGAAYLFDSVTGTLLKTLLSPSPNQFDNFGSDVAIVGNNILIGCPGDDTGGTDAGAAYLFDGNTGELLQTFTSVVKST